MFELTVTLAIIIVTVVVSFSAFNNHAIMGDLIFHPPAITHRNQWYRFLTCGLIHADIPHLAFNMLALYMFGDFVEQAFVAIFNEMGKPIYLLMYLLALVVSLLPTYLRQMHNVHYHSLGASGAVSAVIFAGIFLIPTVKIGFLLIPPFMPGFVFGPLYLILSAYLQKKGRDDINHSAHIWGAVFGIVFLIIACYGFSHFDPIKRFVSEIQSFFQ